MRARPLVGLALAAALSGGCAAASNTEEAAAPAGARWPRRATVTRSEFTWASVSDLYHNVADDTGAVLGLLLMPVLLPVGLIAKLLPVPHA